MDGKFRNSFFVMEFNSRIVAKCVFSSSGKNSEDNGYSTVEHIFIW